MPHDKRHALSSTRANESDDGAANTKRKSCFPPSRTSPKKDLNLGTLCLSEG